MQQQQVVSECVKDRRCTRDPHKQHSMLPPTTTTTTTIWLIIITTVLSHGMMMMVVEGASPPPPPVLAPQDAAVIVQHLVQEEMTSVAPTTTHASEWARTSMAGNETAQFRMGVKHAFGLDGMTREESVAVLHYYFAALAGHSSALAAIGYRHLKGNGVPLRCSTAAVYYEAAADASVKDVDVEPYFVVEDFQVVGPMDGKSWKMSYGDADVLDYYANLASKGDVQAASILGRMTYFGFRGAVPDRQLAMRLLTNAAAGGDHHAATTLGHLLLKSRDPIDWIHAFNNFTVAAEAGHVAAFNGLAYQLLHGRGVTKNLDVAFKYFTKACEATVAEACYNLGALATIGHPPTFQRDFRVAVKHFATAANKGSVLAMHKLGHFYLHGLGVRAACKTAVAYFKAVVERADRNIHKTFTRARELYSSGHFNASLDLYLQLAEMGVEAAESSSARILDSEEKMDSNVPATHAAAWGWWDIDLLRQIHSIMDYLGLAHVPTSGSDVAFDLFLRAAEQGSSRARVRVGDYYYYGWGSLGDPDPVEACSHYRIASDAKDAQGHFNLGMAHHFGDGLARDPQLAKRYYDLALETSESSYLAVWCALKLLWLDNLWRALWLGDRVSVVDDRALARLYDWWWGVKGNSDVDGGMEGDDGGGGGSSHHGKDAVSRPSSSSSSFTVQMDHDVSLALLLVTAIVALNMIREARRRRRERMVA